MNEAKNYNTNKTFFRNFSYTFDSNNHSKSENNQVELIDALIHSQIWLISIPPKLESEKSRVLDELKRIIDLSTTKYQRKPKERKLLIYLSSISVYGQKGSRAVEETDTCTTKLTRGVDRLKDEKLYKDFCNQANIDLVILRLAGIYGKGRSVLDKKEIINEDELEIYNKQDHFFNAIYIKDLIKAIDKIISNYPKFINEDFKKNNIINIADGNPLTNKDKWLQICDLLKISNYTIKPYIEGILPAKQASFWHESKIVSNRKLVELFGYEVKFADYIEGLRDILDQADIKADIKTDL